MHGARVQLEVTPAIPDKIALRVRAIETEEDKGFLHHLLRLERYSQFCIFVWDLVRGVCRPEFVSGCGEYYGRLGFLTGNRIDMFSAHPLRVARHLGD